MCFLINFRQSFASLAPADSSLALFMVDIIEARYVVFEKHKNMLKNSIMLDLFHLTHFSATFGQVFAFLSLYKKNLLWKTQKFVERLNNILINAFYSGILAIFGNFWANFCLVYIDILTTFLREIMVGRYSPLGKHKKCLIWNMMKISEEKYRK